MGRASSIQAVDGLCYAVNDMEPLTPSDAMLMPPDLAELEENLAPAMPATQSLSPSARSEDLLSRLENLRKDI